MASVRKLKPNDPDSPWICEYTDESGKRRRATPKTGLKKDAEAIRRRVEAEIERGSHVAKSETLTVNDAADEFLRHCDHLCKIGEMARKTWRGRDHHCRNHISRKFGVRKVTTLQAQEVQDWIDQLRLKYAGASVQGIYGTLKALLTFCVRKKWLKINPLREEPCRLPTAGRRTAIPSKADIHALLKATNQRGYREPVCAFVNRRVIITLGIFAGLRPGESLGLQWENIDFAKRIIRVRHSYSAEDGLKGPKSEAGKRDIPLTQPVMEALEQLARFRAIYKLAWSLPGLKTYTKHTVAQRVETMFENYRGELDTTGLSGHVVLSKLGEPIKYVQASTFWPRLMKKAGLIDPETKKHKFTPHALRHAAASLFIEAGLPELNLKTVMGHSSVSITHDTYGHLFPEDQRTVDTAEAIAAEFAVPPPAAPAVDATKTRHEHLSSSIH